MCSCLQAKENAAEQKCEFDQTMLNNALVIESLAKACGGLHVVMEGYKHGRCGKYEMRCWKQAQQGVGGGVKHVLPYLFVAKTFLSVRTGRNLNSVPLPSTI